MQDEDIKKTGNTNLQSYIPELRKRFDCNLGTQWMVDLSGRKMTGLFVDCPSFLSSDWMEQIREMIPDAKVNYLSNSQEIIIE